VPGGGSKRVGAEHFDYRWGGGSPWQTRGPECGLRIKKEGDSFSGGENESGGAKKTPPDRGGGMLFGFFRDWGERGKGRVYGKGSRKCGEGVKVGESARLERGQGDWAKEG